MLDLSAAAIEVTHDIALIIVWSRNFDSHDGFEKDRTGFLESVTHGEDRCHGEGIFIGINIVVGAVEDIDMDVDDWVASDDPIGGRFTAAFDTRVDVFFRD